MLHTRRAFWLNSNHLHLRGARFHITGDSRREPSSAYRDEQVTEIWDLAEHFHAHSSLAQNHLNIVVRMYKRAGLFNGVLQRNQLTGFKVSACLKDRSAEPLNGIYFYQWGREWQQKM
ncbi:hypothetical protein Pgy4_14411 [Pseudomonas savastanoi pv. glycinea str. race 4]|uniref:Uncharacterized protein n=1 Tax=Pseudomonas savastanoi pv. glycinea str. race 4 TaxID=875330 RepID=F3C5C8_PSESG|nr:hypothetical protein Pgy4_14411 [Pseudomonas savastanoi pv. glycinea str. race 4]